MTQLFAQPYDISAQGFFFATMDEYREKAGKLRNSAGLPVEEFEIQFIDGDSIDADLFRSVGVHQGNVDAFLTVCDDWDETQKQTVIIATEYCLHDFDLHADDPDDYDLNLFEMDSLRELAHFFVDEGLLGEIPEAVRHYLDYDAIARDLGMDYSEATIGGKNLIFRCE